MEEFLLNFLLWPWLQFQQKEIWLAHLSARDKFFLAAVLLLAIAFAHLALLEKRIKAGQWPRPLSFFTRLFFWFVALVFLGMASNALPQWLNSSNMPIAPHDIKEIKDYRADVSSFRKPIVADLPKTGIVGDSINEYLTDYIRIGKSDRLWIVVFSGTGYISPGDILEATGTIFSWWIAIIISFWAFVYLARRLLRI